MKTQAKRAGMSRNECWLCRQFTKSSQLVFGDRHEDHQGDVLLKRAPFQDPSPLAKVPQLVLGRIGVWSCGHVQNAWFGDIDMAKRLSIEFKELQLGEGGGGGQGLKFN